MGDIDAAFDLVVVGGGPAGVTAALRAAELGARVALVERDRPGGTCTDDGCAPTRVLAKAARLVRDAEQLADYGLSGERPTVDVAALMEATQRTVYELHEKKQLVGHLQRAGIEVVTGRGAARFTDPHWLQLDGTAVRAERVILACGGHARRLPIPGGDLALTHSDIWGLSKLPASLCVIGGAATGLQLASIFAAFGSRVTVLEVAPRVVPGEDPDISAALAAGFQANGVTLVSGIGGVDAIRRTERGLAVGYRDSDSSAPTEVEADVVVLAVGWPGNLEDLGLGAAGVETARGYVAVDDSLRTSAPHVWAAGDVTGRTMLVQSATYEGRVAAENALGTSDRGLVHAIVAHGGFTDPEYGSVGLTEASAGDRAVTGRVAYADLDRAVIDRRTEGFCKLVVDRETRRILGAHVVGEQAVEVVQIAAAAMAAEMPVERLAEVEFAYPTFTSIVGLAARQVVHGLRLGTDAAAWEAMGRPRQAEWERREA